MIGRILAATAVALALAIIALIAVPVSVWHRPAVDSTYQGFDPNLMFISPSGPASNAGMVNVTHTALSITALPGSHPTVDLMTTPLSFSASLDAQVNADSAGSMPLRIGVWSPETRAGYFLVFDHDAGDVLNSETIISGRPTEDLLAGTVSNRQTLGQFTTGQTYRINLAFDRSNKRLTVHVASPALPPPGAHALQLGSELSGITVFNSTPMQVTGGRTYSLGGWVEKVAAQDTFAIGIQWFDSAGKRLASNTDQWWRSPSGLVGWTRVSSDTVAPAQAASARIFLGAAAGCTYLFGGIFLEDRSAPASNLVVNGAFDTGQTGWTPVPGSSNSVGISTFEPLDAEATLSAGDAPDVFAAFRPSLTVSAASGRGISQATIRDYQLVLPSQPSAAAEESVKVDDSRARFLVFAALIAAIALSIAAAAKSLIAWDHHRNGSHQVAAQPASSSSTSPPNGRLFPGPSLLLLAAVAVAYLLGNMFLFHLGSPQFDVFAAKVWSYVAMRNGVADLYYQPLTITSAEVSQGVPIHEAVFPYGITSAYLYLAVGWFFRVFLSATNTLAIDTFGFEVLLKMVNVMCGLADVVLTFLILTRFVSRRAALGSAAILALNPAVIFVMSVWGSTETLSLFFVLASIWLAEKNRPLLAYLMLAGAAFTRPQMFVLAFLLGIVFIRKFGLVRSVMPISWTVVAFFVALGPFALAISPSFPVDYVLRTLSYHLANGQADPNYLGLSPGYYSVWTIPLLYINGEHGIARMWSPSTLFIHGSMTYAQIATDLSVASVLTVGLILALHRPLSREPGRYLPVVAFGMLAWLMLTPGLISRYFVYAIALVILCRKTWSVGTYLSLVGCLTAITFVTSYGHLALDFLGNGVTANVLNPLNNPVSRTIFDLFSNDHFISAGTLFNIAILVVIGITGLRNAPSERPVGQPKVELASSVIR